MKANDIMIASPITVTPDTDIEKAAELMAKNNISGLPVVEEGDKLVGIVSEGDLLGKHKKIDPPAYLEILGGIILLESTKRFFSELKSYVATEVRELMTHDVVTISEDTPLEEMATIMSENNIKRLPVTKNGAVIGIVSRGDILRAMS